MNFLLRKFKLMSDMASSAPFPQGPQAKTPADHKPDVDVCIEDLISYCIIQNWFDLCKETEAVKWTKPKRAIVCLPASLSPAARGSEQTAQVINALNGYCNVSIRALGERQKFLSFL